MNDQALCDELFKKLAKRPSVLVLGQSLLGAENVFLKTITSHFGLDASKAEPLLTQLVEHLDQADVSASLRWLHRRSESVPISESLDIVSEFAWSSVFTSAVDEVWVRAFKKPWRSLNTVFAEDTWPFDTRDRNVLCSTFLFGCVDKEDPDSRIPKGSFELDERGQTAVALLRRLPEIATPLGIVLLEGYDPATDWLKPKDLYPVLNALAPGQAFLFSADPSIKADKYLAKLHQEGKLAFFDKDVASFLRHGAEIGALSFGDPAVKLPAGRQITIDSQPHSIPKDLWLNLTGIATILDDNILMPPRSSSPDQEYVEYRNFLAEPVKANDWSGFAKEFVFQRDFERLLLSECERRLKQTRLQVSPLLVHGESGTGKTVAMAHVAYLVAGSCEFPTLFIDRAVSNPEWRPIDRFLNWAEDCGAPACLIIWDGMREEGQYADLQQRLADRGRKALVVGSTYHADKPSSSRIEAPRELNPYEKTAFRSYLNRFSGPFAEAITTDIPIDSTFLVALYRILPTTRPRLTKGITGELDYAGKDILEKIKSSKSQNTGFNSLEVAFQQLQILGNKADEPALRSETENGELMSEVRDLISLVMVPGKYGFKVPIELLLGALGRDFNSATIAALQTGVLMWSEQPNGDILVAPRHPLEAKMFIDSHYRGAAEAEASYMCKLLLGLKKGPSGNAHIDFAVDLLKHVGPNSPVERNRSHFQRSILTFAETLTRLRKEKSVLSPRLMLQEGVFYREAVRSNEGDRDLNERIKLLEQAESVLIAARERGDCPAGLKSSINAELAACYGSMIHTFEQKGDRKEEIINLYSRAREALKEAVRRDWANAHAVVTLGWISRSILDSSALAENERYEIEAELLFRFDEAIPASMDAIQQDYFLREKMRVMEKLGHNDMAEQTFEALKKTGSKAGYFLRARSFFGEFPDRRATQAEEESLKVTEEYLRHHWVDISTDERCLGLYLKVWWFVHAGGPMFAEERQVLPFNDLDWSRLAEVSAKLKALKDPDCPAWLRFLVALALFQCGDAGKSLLEFREMSSDPNLNAGGNRLKKYFVASENGVPRTFDGVVRGRVEENRFGQVWVNDLRQSIPIVPRDFDKRELRQGETMSDFHIAFSYTGPIAQPPHFLRGRV